MTVDPNPESSGLSRSTDWALIGEVVGVFGIRGEIKVLPATDFPQRFAAGEQFFAGEQRRPYRILSSRPHATLYVLRLDGVDTTSDAERLRGQRLYVPETALAPLPPDRYYRHDIVGLRVEHVNGAYLGVVTDIIEGGSQDVYVVRNESAAREYLLPAVKAFIRSIDLAAGVIRVEPIPGLFDEQAEEAR
jgi:16S rRNA processing protein RimM